jgi:isopenicillin N synthase-like dioxygenase
VDWADLITLDLSQFDTPGGKKKLATQLRKAVHSVGMSRGGSPVLHKSHSHQSQEPKLTFSLGFFYITDFGLTQEEVDQQFAIANEIFALPLEEKLKYRAQLEDGHYNGYRPIGLIEQFPGLRDNFEMYNIFKLLPQFQRSHPAVVSTNLVEIEKFQRHIVENIIRKILTLIAIVLEVPEEILLNGHRYNDDSDCHLRYMIYRARTAEENAKFSNTYAKGHTDFGSLVSIRYDGDSHNSIDIN